MAKTGIINRIRNFFASPSQRQAAAVRNFRRKIRARYDAAQTNDDNTRHWANADALSAAAANSSGVRQILRNRARYEVANNSYARGIVLTLANDSIGTCPRLQLQTANATANRAIELEFSRWARAVDLGGKLRTMRMAKATDGESFAILTTNPMLPSQVQLDLRLIEAEQVTADAIMANADNADGIRFDDFGNPISYTVWPHPGDNSAAVISNRKREYNATDVIHLFRADRPGQLRGIPEIMPALPLFAQLRRFTLATIAAAETAAEFAGVMYTDSAAIEAPEDVEAMDAIELEMRSMLTLPAGWKMGQMQAEHPATTYEMFKHEIINEIARCLNMPFNIAAGNSAGYNYASGRLDHQTYFKSIRVDQSQTERIVLDRILFAWLDEASLAGLIPANLGPFISWDYQWFWDGTEHVDPAKEANAQATRLTNHTTTLAHEYARQGRDWEESLRQRAREMELMRELGLPVDDAASGVAEDPEETEDEETDVEETTNAAA